MKFQYYKIPIADPKRKWIARPMIPIILSGPRGTLLVDALIDSGADRCIFHVDIGKRLGLDLDKSPSEYFTGIEAGRLSSKIHDVSLQIIGMSDSIKVSAGFIDSPGVSAILGQDGFFDAFQIKFERDRNTVEIIPVKSK